MSTIQKYHPMAPIDKVHGIPTRIFNTCLINGFKTLGEVAEQPALFWMSQKNIGRKHTRMLAEVLKSYGYIMPGAARFGFVIDVDNSIENTEGLPIRIKKMCRSLGITSLDQIAMMTKNQWLMMRNIGKKNVAELECVLASNGLSFSKPVVLK